MQNYNNQNDVNECSSRASCSASPTISSLEELAFSFLYQIAYYLLKLEVLGAQNNSIKIKVLNIPACLVSVNEFSDSQLYSIIIDEYYLFEEVKKTYINLCKQKGIKPIELNLFANFSPRTSVAQSISIGEKIFREKYKKYGSNIKNYIEITNIVIKSVCLNLITLNDFSTFDTEVYHEVLESLNLFNNAKLDVSSIIAKISNLSDKDQVLRQKISKLITNIFGDISEVEVSHSSRPGKAILVSGSNFFDLYKLLLETRNKNIDIYTHSDLIVSHSFENFKNFNNLRGHYGGTIDTSIVDFATFPGSILLTKNSRSSNDYYYRGRLFSNDYIIPNGVIKIENNNFSSVIDAAVAAKGFSKGKQKGKTTIGYDEEIVKKKFLDIVAKLKSNKIERLYIIGLDPHSELQKEYFKEIFSKLKRNEFAISFYYESDRDNVFTIHVGNFVPLATSLLKLFFEMFSIASENIIFFFTTCDVMSISSIIKISDLGAKNIYMSRCSPTIINPSVFETFCSTYKIHKTSNPENDLAFIRKNVNK